jgi:hypothetical protein
VTRITPVATAAERIAPWLLAACGFAFDVAAWWPGQMSFDSAYAWWQARGGTASDVVPPGFTNAWRIALWFTDGPHALFAFHLALFWAGLALLAQSLLRSRAAIVALMLLVGGAPLPMLLRGHVWTDVALFSALTFASGLLAGESARAPRRASLTLALLALLYANAMRHNALPAIVPLAGWWAWLASAGRGHVSRGRVAAVALAVLALAFGCNRWMAARVGPHIALWPVTAEYDLAALSVASDRMLLPDFMIGDGLGIAELAENLRDWSSLPLLTGTRHGLRAPLVPPFLSADELSRLRGAWLGAIAAAPQDWLMHRWRVTRALIGTRAADWPVELVYVDAEYAFRDNPSIAPNGTALHAVLMGWARTHVASAWLAAWPYLAIGLLAAPFAWLQRRQPCARLALLLLGSAWLYLLPLYALAPSAEVRYAAWPCVASLIASGAVLFAASRRAARLARNAMEERRMNSVQRYMFSIDDLPKARGESHELSFQGGSAESFAALLQQALREPSLWQRWKAMQPDPDAVDPGLGTNDPAAVVEAHQSDVHVSVEVRSSLPHAVIKHRMTLLIGKHWTLRDVSAA